jgi:hypothetical protein
MTKKVVGGFGGASDGNIEVLEHTFNTITLADHPK